MFNHFDCKNANMILASTLAQHKVPGATGEQQQGTANTRGPEAQADSENHDGAGETECAHVGGKGGARPEKPNWGTPRPPGAGHS